MNADTFFRTDKSSVAPLQAGKYYDCTVGAESCGLVCCLKISTFQPV